MQMITSPVSKHVSANALLVSVIIPVYNRPAMLREAVFSVIEQDCDNLEIIIVDDGSTDETPAVISSLSQQFKPRVRTIRIPNGGAGAAREAGRVLAQGDYIQYLDSDDLLLPGKFSRQIGLLESRRDCGIAYGKTIFQKVGQPLDYKAHKGTGLARDTLLPSMLAERWWSTSTPLYRREVCEQAGPWLPLRNEEDWEFDCRVGKSGVKLAFLDDFVSVTRSHEEGHACADGTTDPIKLRDRCLARMEIIKHALDAGISPEQADFDLFLKGSFLVARQAAMHNVYESHELVSAISALKPHLKIRLYQVLSRVLGPRRAARMAETLYRWHKPGAGQA